MIHVAPLAELERDGVKVVQAGAHSVAVFARNGQVYAVDNRCPHMGFPLHQGTLEGGILTCHWHHARFEASSGCTFDLFADDVPVFDTEVRDGQVLVATQPRRHADKGFHLTRLRQGMEQNIGLVQAKSLLGAVEEGATLAELLHELADYTVGRLNRFGEGLVRLTCVANLFPHLGPHTGYVALLYAVRQIAAESSNSVPRRDKGGLTGATVGLPVLQQWLLQWVRTRDVDAAERTIRAGLELHGTSAQMTGVVAAAAAERLYCDTGHVLDAVNKAFELLTHVGWDRAGEVLPLVLPRMVAGRGEEEATPWHSPVDLVAPLRELERQLPAALRGPRAADWTMPVDLVALLLGDDPSAILAALLQHLQGGAPAESLAGAVAYAAGLRLTHFAESNDIGDWFAAQHTFIFAAAVQRSIARSPDPAVVRSLLHAAMAVYSDRFLNVPPARLPSARRLAGLDALEPGRLLERLTAAWDQRSSIEEAATLVYAYLEAGHPLPALIDSLAFATVREDLDFHSLQVLEAAAGLARHLGPGAQTTQLFVGVARNLAAHCPTRRAGYQTARIAQRLHRGEKVFQDA